MFKEPFYLVTFYVELYPRPQAHGRAPLQYNLFIGRRPSSIYDARYRPRRDATRRDMMHRFALRGWDTGEIVSCHKIGDFWKKYTMDLFISSRCA